MKSFQVAAHFSFLVASFFVDDTAAIVIFTLSLHDALPIFPVGVVGVDTAAARVDEPVDERCGHLVVQVEHEEVVDRRDRKSTRLNSSHVEISYAVFCLKKKITRATTSAENIDSIVPIITVK